MKAKEIFLDLETLEDENVAELELRERLKTLKFTKELQRVLSTFSIRLGPENQWRIRDISIAIYLAEKIIYEECPLELDILPDGSSDEIDSDGDHEALLQQARQDILEEDRFLQQQLRKPS